MMFFRFRKTMAGYGLACMLALTAARGRAEAGTESANRLKLSVYDFDAHNAAASGGWIFTTRDADSRRLWSQTKMMFGIGVVAVGVLYAMPESITGWDRDVQVSELPDRWWRNVSAGPVWDTDDWTFNYIGHPYCGGVYYIMARKSGYNQWDSFLYTAIMSTFFWEYGIEAFAEVPSIQDLIVTPLGGWIYGEWAFRTEKRILANHGRVLGSSFLGHLSLFMLDPIDHFGRGINALVGREWVLTGSVALRQGPGTEPDDAALTLNAGAFAPVFQMRIERRF